jgi:hypothetical protein
LTTFPTASNEIVVARPIGTIVNGPVSPGGQFAAINWFALCER